MWSSIQLADEVWSFLMNLLRYDENQLPKGGEVTHFGQMGHEFRMPRTSRISEEGARLPRAIERRKWRPLLW